MYIDNPIPDIAIIGKIMEVTFQGATATSYTTNASGNYFVNISAKLRQHKQQCYYCKYWKFQCTDKSIRQSDYLKIGGAMLLSASSGELVFTSVV